MSAASQDREATSQERPAGPGVTRGKGTRRSRCSTCGVLVLIEALDSGRCESCTNQRGLFPVKAWRQRRAPSTWSR